MLLTLEVHLYLLLARRRYITNVAVEFRLRVVGIRRRRCGGRRFGGFGLGLGFPEVHSESVLAFRERLPLLQTKMEVI